MTLTLSKARGIVKRNASRDVEGPANWTRPALRGITAFPAFRAHETRKQSSLDAQPIKKIG